MSGLVARLIAVRLADALHMCHCTMDLTATTTRVVPRSEQAAYRAQWRADNGGRDFGTHPYDDAAYSSIVTVAALTTTPAGSWLVHHHHRRGDV